MSTIVLAFDSDWAGRQAAMRAIDKWRNVEYADENTDLQHNGNWCIMAEEYTEYLNLLSDVGIGLHVPKAGNTEDSWWVDPASIRSWPVPRLVAALQRWQAVITDSLFFGNAYNLKFILPLADQRVAELRRELERRATPKLREISHAEDVKGYWDAKLVREKVDPFDIYAQLLPDLEQLNESWLRAACPLHPHKDPPKGGKHGTLSIARKGGAFKCWSCHKEGSLFDFVSYLENLKFPEAVNRVAQLGSL